MRPREEILNDLLETEYVDQNIATTIAGAEPAVLILEVLLDIRSLLARGHEEREAGDSE